jgi:lysozyme
MKTKLSKQGLEMLKKFEGFSSHAYKCPAGVITIGYGFTKGVKLGDKITLSEAEKRLKLEVIPFEKCVVENCYRDINQSQFDALVLLAYNIGASAFKKSTLLKMLNDEKSDIAEISKQFLRWNKAGGKELAGLSNRRIAERELFLA